MVDRQHNNSSYLSFKWALKLFRVIVDCHQYIWAVVRLLWAWMRSFNLINLVSAARGSPRASSPVCASTFSGVVSSPRGDPFSVPWPLMVHGSSRMPPAWAWQPKQQIGRYFTSHQGHPNAVLPPQSQRKGETRNANQQPYLFFCGCRRFEQFHSAFIFIPTFMCCGTF